MSLQLKKLLKNIFSISFGNFFYRVILFVLLPVFTAYLTTTEFGYVDIVNSTIELLLPLLTLSMYESVFRFTMDEEIKGEVFSNSLLSIGFIAFAMIIGLSVVLFIEFSVLYILIFIMFFLFLLKNYFNSMLRGLQQIALYSMSNVIFGVFLLGFSILFLVFFEYGIYGYFYSFIISHLITLIIIFIFGKLWIYIDLSLISKEKLREYLAYSLPLVPNTLFWWIANLGNRYIILTHYDLAQVGIYSAASKLPALINVAALAFLQAWQISSITEKDEESRKRLYSKVFSVYFSLLIIGTIIMIILTPYVSKFALSNDFYDGWIYTPMMIVASVFSAYSFFFGAIFTTYKKNKYILTSTLTGALINVVLSAILIDPFGLIGVAFAFMISYLSIWVIRMITSKKIMEFSIDYTKIFITILLLIISLLLFVIYNTFTAGLYVLFCVLVVYHSINVLKFFLDKKEV